MTSTAWPARMRTWQPADIADVTGPGNSHHRPAELAGTQGSDEGAAAPGGFHDQGPARECGDDPVTGQEPVTRGERAGRVLADHRTVGSDVIEQTGVLPRVGEVRAAGEHRHSAAAAGQGGAVGGDVDAVGTAGNDHPAGGAESRGDLGAHVPAVGSGSPGADHCDRLAAKVSQIRGAPYPQGVGTGQAKVIELARPARVTWAEQVNATSLKGAEPGPSRDSSQPCPPPRQTWPDPGLLSRAQLPGHGVGHSTGPDRGHDLARIGLPQEGSEEGIGGFGEVGQGGSCGPGIAWPGAHRIPPRWRASAWLHSSWPGWSRPSRSARVQATRRTRCAVGVLIWPRSTARWTAAIASGGGR